jgi:hypothetical protein
MRDDTRRQQWKSRKRRRKKACLLRYGWLGHERFDHLCGRREIVGGGRPRPFMQLSQSSLFGAFRVKFVDLLTVQGQR